MLLAAPVFLLVEGLLIWNVVRYRKRDDASPPQITGSTTLLRIDLQGACLDPKGNSFSPRRSGFGRGFLPIRHDLPIGLKQLAPCNYR